MATVITALIERSELAYRETSKWARVTLGISFVASLIARASAQHFWKSHMTWTEVLTDVGIFGCVYAASLAVIFVWNFIFAPARLERERKKKAGQESLDQVLKLNAKKATKALNKLT